MLSPTAQVLCRCLLQEQTGTQLQAVSAIPCAFPSLQLQLELLRPWHPEVGHLWMHQKCWIGTCTKQDHPAFRGLVCSLPVRDSLRSGFVVV